MACRLLAAKPLYVPVLTCGQTKSSATTLVGREYWTNNANLVHIFNDLTMIDIDKQLNHCSHKGVFAGRDVSL